MSFRAIKYRVYPTDEQKEFFIKSFGCCRKIYNLMLADKIAYYKATGKTLMTTPAQYKKDYPYLSEVDSLALTNVQMNLQEAYAKFFKKKNKFPKFKSLKHCRKSYTTNNQKGTVSLLDNAIKLPKIGAVKAKIHRLPEENWVLKAATVSQSSDGKFYISIRFEYEDAVAVIINPDNVIGLDYKSDGLYIDSNGKIGTNHKFYRENHKKLAKEQRRLSRKIGSEKNEVKSNNYLKQLKKVNKIHRHIANQRLDNLHKKSAEIANQYDAVCVEDLNMRAMSNKGFGNGKATLDNGYGIFLKLLEYKLNDRGKKLIKVDKWYPSSQLCHNCGSRKKLKLEERVYQCPSCSLTIDRDYNAAINIKKEGLRILKLA